MAMKNISKRFPKYVHCHLTDEDTCESNQELGWFFWDETWDCHGPWGTVEEAENVFESYYNEVLG
jgi:hypothetical protein